MKIPSLYKQKKPVFSLEIFPPKRKTNRESLYDTVAQLAECQPDFISVTYGAGGNIADNSTCEIAANIKKNYGIETVAHLTCVNSTREDVQEMIARFQDADIENVMALRGDIVPGEDIKREFKHANELAIEIQRKCNDQLEILGACYPEGHYQSESLDSDIQNLKYKIGAGVKVLITQLFFDNDAFYEFLDLARSAGQSEVYDNVVFVNCTMSKAISSAGWYSNPSPNPSAPTATGGWREFGSKDAAGKPVTGHNAYSKVLSASEAQDYLSKESVLGW